MGATERPGELPVGSEIEDLGGITIEKQFKPAPPYIDGTSLERTGYEDKWQ